MNAVRQFIERIRKARGRRNYPLCPDTPFQERNVVAGNRIVFCASGVLPGTPNYRHLVVVAHLRYLDREGLERFRIGTSTHEIWIWIQSRKTERVLWWTLFPPKQLIFRGQFDAGSEVIQGIARQHPDSPYWRRQAEQKTHECARFVGREIMFRLQVLDAGWKVPSQTNYGIWAHFTDRAVSRCYLDGEETAFQH